MSDQADKDGRALGRLEEPIRRAHRLIVEELTTGLPPANRKARIQRSLEEAIAILDEDA